MARTDLLQLRRDTSTNWESTDPILEEGEIGYDTTTTWIKIGDGTTAWTSLPYYSGQDMMLQISKGNIPGHSSVNVFGQNTDIDTGTTPEDIWTQGSTWVAPTGARTHAIVSSSANDTSLGTGAKTVTVYGLDSSWALANETVTMNGTTNVNTASTYRRIFRMEVDSAGSGETNAGTITATAATDATVTAAIAAGDGKSAMAMYTVPASTSLYLTRAFAQIIGSSATGRADVELHARPAADVLAPTWLIQLVLGVDSSGSSFASREFAPYQVFSEKTDILLQCSGVSASNLTVAGGFDGILVES